MPEWSNGTGLGQFLGSKQGMLSLKGDDCKIPVGLVPTQVRTLHSASYFFIK